MDFALFQVAETEFNLLDCKKAFSQLTKREKLYAHWLNKAAWAFSLVTYQQTSDESLPLLNFLIRLFEATKESSKVASNEWTLFKHWAGVVLYNSGNYRGFGDSKIVVDPSVSPDFIENTLLNSDTFIQDSIVRNALLEYYNSNKLHNALFELSEPSSVLGFPDEGHVSSYYSFNVTKDDMALASKYLKERMIYPQNTRLMKREDGSMEIRVASIEKRVLEPEMFEGAVFQIVYGDYSEDIERVISNLDAAIPYVSNESEAKMIREYIEHFKSGDMVAFARSQDIWVKDLQPTVEFNIGFIETYRDPLGIRAEAEGWVGISDKEQSRKFVELVAEGIKLVGDLPWGDDFNEKELDPQDFSSIDILGFSQSVPLGINIPNAPFNEKGSKNLSLQNSLLCRVPTDKPQDHLSEEDNELVRRHFVAAEEIQVGLHENLGHGSGKLLRENKEGKLNFSRDLINPLTGKPVDTWYKDMESFDTVFKENGSSIEECRAECVGLYLCTKSRVLDIFGFSEAEKSVRDDVVYVNWLSLVRSGVIGLKMYSPSEKKWKQAHSRARYAILKRLLKGGLVKYEWNDGKDDFVIRMDRERIWTDGRDIIGQLLLEIGIWRFTANAEAALQGFDTEVDEEGLRIREVLIAKTKPRPALIQHNTVLSDDGENVELVSYESTVDGMIQSFVDRFRGWF